MMTQAPHPRFLVLTYPLLGHINPSLQFSKRLSAAAEGAPVTFVTTVAAHHRMSTTTSGGGNHSVSYAPFSDGCDDGVKPADGSYLSEFRRRGSKAISDLVSAAAAEGRPYTCLVYSILVPWAGITAGELGLPSFLLWIQPAAMFYIYYYYFHGYEEILKSCSSGKKTTLPGLSLQFTSREIPSFLDSEDSRDSKILRLFRDLFEVLDMRTNPKILVNSFDELETEALGAIVDDRVTLIGIGPLIPSAYLDEQDPSDTSFGADLFKRSTGECKVVEWLNLKPKSSVIYVSFGSISVLSNPQMEEMAKGLLDCGRPFLWVVREEAEKLSCREELEKLGLIVPWCGQVEVLSNEAVGCFVSHCGWNSTLESLVAGVPVVAFPQWSDQGTNAKLIEEVWKTGVRVRVDDGNDGTVKSKEIKRCVDKVFQGEEFRINVMKWSCLARESASQGGPSDRNLKDFVAGVVGNGNFNHGSFVKS